MATHEKRGNSYKISVSLGYDINGNQIRKRTTWTPAPGMTQKQEAKELERQKVLFEERCRSGQVLESNMKLAEFVDIWMRDHAERNLKAKTVARYRDLLKRILPALGHIKLERLQPHHLVSFYANLEESGIREDTKYKCKKDFKALLKERDITKVSLAEQAGVSIAVLNSITQERNISKDSAGKVSCALGIDKAVLFEAANGSDTLSSTTVRRYHELLSSIMNTAVQWGVVFSNPCDRVKPPKVEKSKPRYLDEKEARRLIELLEDEPPQYKTIIMLLLYTGLRRGELCGLEWSDIDFDKNVIYVRRESLYLAEKGVFEDTCKTDSSERVIKAPTSAIDLLRQHRAWQNQERLIQGDRWKNCGRLFTGQNGQPIHPDIITNWFSSFVAKNDLPDISIHSLRHTHATLMIASGAAVTTVANRLGHANASTTTKIYAHAIRSADEAAAEAVEDMLNPTKRA